MIVNRTLNKVISSSSNLQDTLLDLTLDTVAPGNLVKNETAHDNEGESITGRFLTEDAEAWAVGQRNGVPVSSDDITYHNNSKWYSEVSDAASIVAGSCMLIAGEYADNAEESAVICSSILPVVQTNAQSAEANALKSEGHAIGKQNGTDVTSESPYYHNNSKYWAEYARQYAEGGIHYKASLNFANIPTTGMITGDMYDIKDDFTTDNRFEDGAGIECKASTNIIWNANSKWDIDVQGSGAGVTGVKGNAEETYRRGNVNLTPADLGALATDGDSKDNTTTFTSYDEQTTDKTDAGFTGYKNLIPYPYYNKLPRTHNGITFTIGSDGRSIVANGTATEMASYAVCSRLDTSGRSTFPNGTYIISGCPDGGANSAESKTYWIATGRTTGGSNRNYALDTGDGATITLEGDDYSDTEVRLNILIQIGEGQTVTNLTFYPMLRETIEDSTYVPAGTVPTLESAETHQSLFGKISAMFSNIRKLWNTVGFETEGVNKIIGDTSVTFTHEAIQTTSELHLLSENTSNTPIFYTAVSVSSGSATYTFPALTVATTFYLVIK